MVRDSNDLPVIENRYVGDADEYIVLGFFEELTVLDGWREFEDARLSCRRHRGSDLRELLSGASDDDSIVVVPREAARKLLA